MSAATGTILGGVAIASQVGGAIIANRAAGKAADQQTASAQQALGLQGRMYDQTRQDLGPYRQQGTQALTSLSNLLGVPMAAPAAAPPAPTVPGAPAPPITGGPLSNASGVQRGLVESGFYGPGATVIPRPYIEQGKREGLTLRQIGDRWMAEHPQAGTPGAPAGQPGVRLRAPNGQTQVVPADQVSFYEARGASRV